MKKSKLISDHLGEIPNDRDRIFLVDGNFYLHRGYSICGSIDPLDGVAKLFLSMIFKDALANRCNKILVAFDGWDIFRYRLYKKYKSSRSGDSKGSTTERLIYTQSLPHLQKILSKCGIPHVQIAELEADDVLASTCQLPGTYVIGTRDKDSYQLVNDRVQIYVSVGNPHTITEREVKKKFGLPPHLMVMYQTLVGDKIDDIPSIRGLTNKQVMQACLKYGSITNWYKNANEKTQILLKTNRDRIKRNRDLVFLIRDRSSNPNKVGVDSHTKWDKSPKSFIEYCQFVNPKVKSLF